MRLEYDSSRHTPCALAASGVSRPGHTECACYFNFSHFSNHASISARMAGVYMCPTSG
jgi:hypothetical protein